MPEEEKNSSVLHALDENSSKSSKSIITFFVFLVIICAGIGIGYIATRMNHTASFGMQTGKSPGTTSVGTVMGSTDTSTFKDTAEGTMVKGGIDGEGQYHLTRKGGDSQNVYLTSSIVDLSQFVGHHVKVWGQTNSAQHAGWLMDVGRVEVEQ